MSLAASITLLGALFGEAATPPADSAPQSAQPESGALPLELTAFGDVYYARSRHERHGFHIGSLEVGAVLELVPFVHAFGAIAYDPAAEVTRVASFAVDSGLWGSDEHALFKSSIVDASGIIIGKFDVPFGVAYLHYSSPDNRLVTQPLPVVATHGAWSDLGAQAYLALPMLNLLGYYVNGTGLPATDASAPDSVAGGRFGFRPFGKVDCDCRLELGGSAARGFGPEGTELTLLGLDLSAELAGLDVHSQVIQERHDGGPSLLGFYSQGVLTLDPVFFGGRYAIISQERQITERAITASLGLEIFPEGELRVAYERGLDQHTETLFVQIAGGTSWKPTGLRR